MHFYKFKNRVAMLVLLYCAASSAWALDVEIFERDADNLGMHLIQSRDSNDEKTLKKIEGLPFVKKLGDNDFNFPLDSTPGIAKYLRAARLGRGIYVYLPLLCPDSDCSAINFKLKARLIMFGNDIFKSSVGISGQDARNPAAFLINEEKPRLEHSLYIDPGFSKESEERIDSSLAAILKTYRDLVGENPVSDRGIVITFASDSEGATGFGGDSLNIIRLTFHNRRKEPEDYIVDLMIRTFAHEIAHSLHSPQLMSIPPHGRVISEGSADFMRGVTLRRAGLIDGSQLQLLVAYAYDECQARRDNHTLKERVQAQSNHYKELYNCGMIYYFAQMFEFTKGSANDREFQMARRFAADFRAVPSVKDEEAACLLMLDGCPRPRLKAILGDATALRSQRTWFDEQLANYVQSMVPENGAGLQPIKAIIDRRP